MTQHELWTAYRRQVRVCALTLWARTTPTGRHCTDTEELIAAGEWALWQAAGRYDPGRGGGFWAYARPRVWGAMVDWLRQTGAGKRGRPIKVQRFSEIEPRPTDAERAHAGPGLQLEAALAVSSLPPDRDAEARDEVARQLRQLRERERAVMVAYHLKGLTMRQTAARVGLSESRVSQILSNALSQLREIAGLPPLPTSERPSKKTGR